MIIKYIFKEIYQRYFWYYMVSDLRFAWNIK